jgi:prolipoprotein diacylglyceryltransferase
MKSMIEITTTNGQFYYDLFYFLAIVFAGVFFMIDGRRKKYPMIQWALIFSSGIIFLIIGTKLFTYTPNDWKEIANTLTFPYTERKTILGGITGGIFGIWLAKKLTNFPYPVLDSFAVSFPVAMGIQRIGCFMVGCCFGTPTKVPWAVSYSYYAHPYYIHLERGWIVPGSYMSAPIHPNQLYQTILCLLIAFIIWKLRNKFKRQGNLFFTSIALYLVARFIVEFWRDGATNGITGIEWMGIKYLQWGLLAGIIMMALFIFLREKRYKQEIIVNPKLINPVWYFILLCVFVLIARNWFTKTEFFFIEFVLLPSMLIQLYYILDQNSNTFKYKLAIVYSLILVLISSGTVIAQKTYENLTRDDFSRNTFTDVNSGFGNFKYSHYHSAPTWVPPHYDPGGDDGCGGTIPAHTDPGYWTTGKKYTHNSKSYGMEISHIRTYGSYQRLTLNGAVSGIWDSYDDSFSTKTIKTFDFATSAKYDFRWFGAGVGIHTGQNIKEYKMDYNNEEYIYSNNDQLAYQTHLSGSLRFGPYDIAYGEFRYNDYFPYQLGHRADYAYQVLIGSGLGFKNGTCIEQGIDGNGGMFFSGKVFIHNNYGIKTTLYTGIRASSDINNYSNQMLQFSMIYRFNGKHWRK